MKCVICKTGETKTGKTTYTIVKVEQVVVVKGVVADVCQNCSEAYFSIETSDLLSLKVAEAMVMQHEVEVVRF